MARGGSGMFGSGRDELSAPQMYQPGVNGALGEPGCIGNCADTGADMAPVISQSLTVKVEVNQERSWLLIVPEQVAHQHIEHIIVDRQGAFETRHNETMKREGKRKKRIPGGCIDKRTAVFNVPTRSSLDGTRALKLRSTHHDQTN